MQIATLMREKMRECIGADRADRATLAYLFDLPARLQTHAALLAIPLFAAIRLKGNKHDRRHA